MLTLGVQTSACTCGSVKNLRAAAGTTALGLPHSHFSVPHPCAAPAALASGLLVVRLCSVRSLDFGVFSFLHPR